MFSKLGIPFDVANNKAQALEYIKKHDYSLILLDIQMPKDDGYSVARAIRSINAKLPIIAFTTLPEDQVLPKAIDSGMNEYMLKPSAMQELRSMVDRFKLSA
jgi:CheY-like chemotaxis protein